MNVVVMQPFYLFLRKHFHQVQRADLYIFMDDTQFVKNSHHNRNRIKGVNGLIWLTVPVVHSGKFGQKLNEAAIDNTRNWRKKHWESILQSYRRAPHFKLYADFFEDVYRREWTMLAELNMYLIRHIASFLGIRSTEFRVLSEMNVANDNPTQRLIDICEHVGATRYIIGTRAKDYMEDERWASTRVALEYFEPDYPPYPQQFGEFAPHVAIIDLLFNCGKESGRYIWGDSERDG